MAALGNSIDIICLESEALKSLVRSVSESLKADHYPWIDETECMDLFSISSKTTMREYREKYNLDVRYTSSKHIIYRRQSVLDCIENLPKSHKP